MTEATIPPPNVVEEGRRRRARKRAREAEQKRVRTLVTPEGAALNLKISTFGERFGAFVLDIALQFIIMFAIIFAIASISR